MRSKKPSLFIITLLCALRGWVLAGQESVRVDLKVSTVDGVQEQPFKLTNEKAAIFIFVLTDCPITNRSAPEIRRIMTDYGSRGVAFHLVYSDPHVPVKEVQDHLHTFFGGSLPIFVDVNHVLAKETGVNVTPEAVVTDRAGRIVYRGRIDDSVAEISKPWREPTQRDLCNALDAILKEQPVAVPRTKAVGCYISDLP